MPSAQSAIGRPKKPEIASLHEMFGVLWTKLYGFHHMHHANISCNEAISGFFGLPIADWALGTYHQPRELLLEGRMATAKDFAVPAPPRIVRWFDQWAKKRESKLMRSADNAPREAALRDAAPRDASPHDHASHHHSHEA